MKKKMWFVLCIMTSVLLTTACGEKKEPGEEKKETAVQTETAMQTETAVQTETESDQDFQGRESLKLGLFTVDDLREQVIMLYAGRNAERLFAAENNMTENGVTTGASNDIEKATGIIKKMITEYGMSKKFGLLNLEELDVKPDVITEEAVKLAEELNEESFNMMKGNADKLKKIAEKLVEKETLTGKEIEEIAG